MTRPNFKQKARLRKLHIHHRLSHGQLQRLLHRIPTVPLRGLHKPHHVSAQIGPRKLERPRRVHIRKGLARRRQQRHPQLL